MSDMHSERQVSLAGAASGKKKSPSKKKPLTKKQRRLIVIVAILVVALLVVLLARGCKADEFTYDARNAIQYTVTADDSSDKVSYFTLAVQGEKATDRLDMVAVMCFDRKAGKITVMQVPVATYLGEDATFAVSTVGDVWGNPKSIVWCDTCRTSVAADAVDGSKHTTCGTKLTSRKGSAFTDFNRVFNTQFALPTDNYLVVPRDGLIKLIDLLGGVDMQLDADIQVDEDTYQKGARTLSGKAAVYYATEYNYNNTPASDIERMMRQRQLFASIVDRLSSRSLKELYNDDPKLPDLLSNFMLGADPIRFDSTTFGKMRLMNVSERKAEKAKLTEAMARFFYDVSRVDLEDFTYCLLPGAAVKRGTGYVYSVSKAQTIQLLNETMNPCGLPIDDTTVAVTELTSKAEGNTAMITLDKVLVKPSI